MKKILSNLKILVVFIFLFIFSTNIALAILIDTSFGTGGKTTTTFSGNAVPNKVLTQTNGKFLVAGYRWNASGNRDWVVARYNVDGNIDVSFDGDGILLRDFGNHDVIFALANQDDNKIIVGGYSTPGFTWTLSRYNTDGSQDITFGSGGTVTYIQGLIMDLVLQPDGKIIAVGYFVGFSGGHDDVAIVRYNSDGSLDPTFGGGDGIVITPIGPTNDRGGAVALQPDGEIVVLGSFDAGGHDEVFLARYNDDGSMDNTFGIDGKTITHFGGSNGAYDVALDSDNNIIITGVVLIGGARDTFVARYNTNGVLDASFDDDGKVVHSFSSGNDWANSLVLQPNGKIIVAGTNDVGGSVWQDFMFARFNIDGSLDTTFGTNGLFTTPIGSGYDEIRSTLLQPDGKIIAVGNTHNGSYNDWVIARFSDEEAGANLPVPSFKQNASSWGSTLYDSADLWAIGATDMATWGCAVTSAAMVFNYHGLDEISPGVDLNPGTLNEWLKGRPDGYIRNGVTNWEALAVLSSEIAEDNGVDFDALEVQAIKTTDKQDVKDALDLEIPDILREPGHFVVAHGYNEDTIHISDPFFNRNDLTEYGDTFERLVRFTPSSTDLSYIMLVVDADSEIHVFDENGNEIGVEILEEPITDPSEENETSAETLKVIYVPKPESGTYRIDLNGQDYLLDAYLYDSEGDVSQFSFEKTTGDSETTYFVNFSKDDSSESEVEEEVTYDSLISDVEFLYQSGEIKNYGAYISIAVKLKVVKFVWSDIAKKAVLRSVKSSISTFEKRGKITEEAADYLIERINILIGKI